MNREQINDAIDIEALKQLFKEIDNKIGTFNEDLSDLNDLREKLGPYYGLFILSDRALYNTWNLLDRASVLYRDRSGITQSSNDNLEKRLQVMIYVILHLYPGAVLADFVVKRGLEPYLNCFGIHEGDFEKYGEELGKYLKTYKSGLYDPHLLHLKEMTYGIVNFDPEGEENYTSNNLCSPKISSLKEYDRLYEQSDLADGKTEHNWTFPEFRKHVTVPTFSPSCPNLNETDFTILYFHCGCNTNYSLQEEDGVSEDGVSVQLFLTLKKDDKGKFYYPKEVALAILGSMNRLATVAALQKLQEQQRQLERESQMLRLLMEPLNQVTAGLEQARESAQRLQAVIYDPQQGIFSAASRVWRYFEEGSQIDIAGEPVVIAHNLNDYKKEKDGPKRLSLILLAILSEIFGYDPKNITSTTELWARVYSYIEGGDPAFKDPRNTCKKIIETSSVSSSAVFKVLQEQVDGSGEMEKKMETHLGEVWNRFKKLLHEPYKFHPNSFSIMPLALTVLVQEKPIEIKKEKYEDLRTFLDSSNGDFKVFLERDLPFPRPAVLWTLVQHLASQQTPALESATVEDQKIELIFDGCLFEQKQDALATTLEGLIKTESSTGFLGGDSTSHWFEFACACGGEETYAEGVERGFSIFIKNRSTQFSFEVHGKTVSFKVIIREKENSSTISKTTDRDDESNVNIKEVDLDNFDAVVSKSQS